jgi:hypothetical protein
MIFYLFHCKISLSDITDICDINNLKKQQIQCKIEIIKKGVSDVI